VEIRKSLRCPNCGKKYDADLMVDAITCPHCNHRLPKIDQVTELLEEWYYPRRWIKAVERPRARFLIERLWQQQFEPKNLYESLAPRDTNFEVFCYTVTGVVIKGIEAGWVKLDLPEDPLVDDPIYRLQILDLERFTEMMEKAMPDVNWDEDIDVVDTGAPPQTSPS
jgi:DNA-directed RNA polymerase subunit RPC12/RpoP